MKWYQGFPAETNHTTLWKNTKVARDSQYFTLNKVDDADGKLYDPNYSKEIVLF